ncbi:MAG: hypothetical protein JXR84_26380 [Anaerolineae bacterium]|nr:hypothetical protein [Anaerolineae bacterium]
MKTEHGQALVILAFALITVAAFAGLAIDGGRLYSARRQTQNTADAIAVAGTRLLATYISQCESVDRIAADDAIATEMVKFARDNGIDPLGDDAHLEGWYVDSAEARLGHVGWGTGIPDGATGIEASLVTTDTTTFLKLVGQLAIDAPGKALAMTGPVRQFTGGILPLGVPLEVVETLAPDETFQVADNLDGAFCRDPNNTLCIGDPTNANSQRGWLNLNYIYNTEYLTADAPLNRSFERSTDASGCGSIASKSVDDGLTGFAGEDKDGDGNLDCPYPFPILAGLPGFINGDFIHGSTGGKTSGMLTIMDFYAGSGKVAYLPVFDFIYQVCDMSGLEFTIPEEPPDGSHNENWPTPDTDYFYHIVGFAALTVDDDTTNHTLVGNFQNAIIGEGQIQPGAGFGESDTCSNSLIVTGVQLWR